MRLDQLKPIHKRKKRKRIGRGGKKGTYSGRGIKGQKARAGRKLQPLVRELIKRYPKLRGYRFKIFKKNIAIINVGILEKKFKADEIINPKTLIKKHLIRRIKGRVPGVKILGKGEIKKPVIIEGCKLSKSAEDKIKKAGGKLK